MTSTTMSAELRTAAELAEGMGNCKLAFAAFRLRDAPAMRRTAVLP
jgi:hypothetical protein